MEEEEEVEDLEDEEVEEEAEEEDVEDVEEENVKEGEVLMLHSCLLQEARQVRPDVLHSPTLG